MNFQTFGEILWSVKINHDGCEISVRLMEFDNYFSLK